MRSRILPPALSSLALIALVLAAPPAHATLEFQKVFVREYIADHANRDFATLVQRKAKCNICHQGCKDRTQHNRYGAELAKLLDHRVDKDNVEKIVAALRTVDDLPSEPSRPGAPTFGELIRAAKLPGGELVDVKREPAG